jgi:hypothetical protein
MLAGWFPQEGPALTLARAPNTSASTCRNALESCTLATVAVCSRMEIWGGDEGKGKREIQILLYTWWHRASDGFHQAKLITY